MTKRAHDPLIVGWSAYPWVADARLPSFERVAEQPYLVRAGSRVWVDGRSGIWNAGLGHAPAKVVRAIQRAAVRPSTSTVLQQDSRRARVLAQRLLDAWGEPGGLVSLGVTGTQAIDRALRVCLSLLSDGGARPRLVAFSGAYHGESGLARAAGSAPGLGRSRATLRLPAPNCRACPVGRQPDSCAAQCLDQLHGLVAQRVPAALVFEPVQITSGALLPTPAFAHRLQHLRREAGPRMLVIADEVAGGMHRTGPLFAQEQLDLRADVTVLGKALTAGLVPLSAVLLSRQVAVRLRARAEEVDFGGTYDGYRIGVEAALATLALLRAGRMPARVTRLQAALAAGLGALARVVPVATCGAVAVIHTTLPALRFEQLRLVLRRRRLIVHEEHPLLTLLPPLVMPPRAVRALAADVAAAVEAHL